MKEISVFDAKTHFSGVIADVIDNHEEFIITRRGERVAKIIPFTVEEKRPVEAIIKEMDALSKELGATGITQDEIKKMREEGQK